MPEPHVVFLTTDPANGHNDNGLRLPRAFREAGWRVTVAEHEALTMGPLGLAADGVRLAEVDLVWPIGFGPRASYFDRTQMLSTLPSERLINDPMATLLLHGKFGFEAQTPETYAALSPDPLLAQLAKGGEWVLKPSASSFGRGVTPVTQGPAGIAAVRRAFEDGAGAVLLQRRIMTDAPEHRTLMIGERILGTYARSPEDGLRANLSAGGRASTGKLTAEELSIVRTVMARLASRAIRFAAIDTLGRYLIEVNVANPGGLETLSDLYGDDPAGRLAEYLLHNATGAAGARVIG